MEREISYGEIAYLQTEFNRQCEKLGVVWDDMEVKQEALNEFIRDYEDGNDNPEVILCGYGYAVNKMN